MTTTAARVAARSSTRSIDPSTQLRTSFAAVRLSLSWLGVRKTLTSEQKEEAADAFGAEGEFLSAAKKLLDTRHPAYKTVTAVRGKAISLWRGLSLPFPDPGVRLIRQGDIETFDNQMKDIQQELADAVEALDRAYADLRQAAKERLGRLYNEGDYPTSLQGLFSISWDFPSVEPPDYLRQLKPELYEEERRRVSARFEEAVKLAEDAFTCEFAKLVSHLTERLTGSTDGEAKVFRDSAISNLTEFFEKFRHLGVHSSGELDRLVGEAQRLVSGLAPDTLRQSPDLRHFVGAKLAGVATSLDELLMDRPRRRVVRGMVAPAAESTGAARGSREAA